MVTHNNNNNGENRGAFCKSVLNKINLRWSFPAASLQHSWYESSQQGFPSCSTTQVLMRFFSDTGSSKQLIHIWSPLYLSKSDNDYRWSSDWVLNQRGRRSVLTTAPFIFGGLPEIFLSVGSGAPCRPALLWALPRFHLIVCFILIARWSNPAALGNKICFLFVFSVLFSFVYVY